MNKHRASSTKEGVTTAINRVLDVLDLILGSFLAILMIAMTAGITIQVLARYVFGYSMPWLPAALRYASATLTFIGAGYLVRYGEHIGLSFIQDIVSRRVKQVMILLGHGITIWFLIWVIHHGLVLAERHLAVESAAFFQIPLYYPYMVLPIGMGIMLVYYVLTTVLVLLNTSTLLDKADV